MNIKTVFLSVLVVNLITVLIYFYAATGKEETIQNANQSSNFLTSDEFVGTFEREEPPHLPKTIPTPKPELQAKSKPVAEKTTNKTSPKIPDADIFVQLGAYPKYVFEDYSFIKPKYDTPDLGFYNDDDYCKKVDQYNLAHPDNMLKKKNFFTEYPLGTLPRRDVMQKIGKIVMGGIDRKTPPGDNNPRYRNFSLEINNFFAIGNFHRYREIGKHFLCATQMYNHIPGTGHFMRKDTILEHLAIYADKYKDKPQCFDRKLYFPMSYRLYVEQECKEFFNMVNSEAYNKSLEKEPIQYLVKVGHGAHKSQGVSLLDEEKRVSLNSQYNFGEKCGGTKNSLIVQKYITNPLLLDRKNKFDFRVYMLIASTNPLIAYYHDGYLRVSINEFDKSSKDKATHLTNTYLAEKKFDEMKKNKTKLHGMTADELKDYHLWTFKDLQEYLLETGRIKNRKWLANSLRPAFQKAFIHLLRMSSTYFWNQSNVYELHGLDFMLDDDLNLWFIESNSNPLLIGVKPKLITTMLKDLFEIEYAYYKSRMRRVLDLIKRMRDETNGKDNIDFEKWRKEYKQAIRNRLEPQYALSKNNTFTMFLNEYKKGENAYFGHLPAECI